MNDAIVNAMQKQIECLIDKYLTENSIIIKLSPVDAGNLVSHDSIEIQLSLTIGKNAFTVDYINEEKFKISEDSIAIKFVKEKAKTQPVSVVQLSLQDYRPDAFSLLLQFANKVCSYFTAKLLVYAPNISREDIALRLLSGKFDDPFNDVNESVWPFFTHSSLNNLLTEAGFSFVEENNLEIETNPQASEDNVFLCQGTMLYDHLSFYRRLCDPYGKVRYFIRIYQTVQQSNNDTFQEKNDHPFLSVVVRTVGNRPEPLREALLCLAAQDDTNFEVLVIGHKIDSSREKVLQNIIDELPFSLKKRTRLIKVNHGNRSTPLNEGFIQARGTYIAALDDDDLVTGDWVESFHDAYQKAPGALLHCYCVSQEWSIYEETDGTHKLIANAAPSNIFCQPFNWREQFKVNRCPLMTIAFPSDAFRRFSYRFDEKLDTVEDWDYIMTMAMILGVYDIPRVTAIYRLWNNAQSSYTLHDKSEWDKNMSYVLEKLSHIPMMFPRGVLIDKEVGQPSFDGASVETEIYVNAIGQSNKKQRIKPTNQQHLPDAIITTFDNLEQYQIQGKVRLDPTDIAHYELTRLSIHATMLDGTTAEYGVKNVTTNGAMQKSGILFPADDPQIYFSLPKGTLVSLRISYTLCWGIPFKKLARFMPNLIVMCIRILFSKGISFIKRKSRNNIP